MTLPDFLGIGAQKAGTSWLHYNLRVHPEAFLPEPKEVHYFDQKLDQPIETYAEVFKAGAGRVKGEITPAYGILPREVIRAIRGRMPGLRLIFLMRNPIERAWSHAMMSLSWQVGRAYESIRDEEFVAHFHSAESRRRGDYENILNNWLGEFPASQFFTGFYDDISVQPRELLSRIFAHLGISVNVDWSRFPVEQVVYPGAGVELPERFRRELIGIYEPEIRALHRRFGSPVQRWLP